MPDERLPRELARDGQPTGLRRAPLFGRTIDEGYELRYPSRRAPVPRGSLLEHGIRVGGNPTACLNTVYEPSGEFGGMPLYRAVCGGEAGMYYRVESSKWILTARYSEEIALRGACNSAILAEDRAVPLGEDSWNCLISQGNWEKYLCTTTALSAAEMEAAKARYNAGPAPAPGPSDGDPTVQTL